MADLHFFLIMWIYKTVFMCVHVCVYVCKLIYTHDLKTEKGLEKEEDRWEWGRERKEKKEKVLGVQCGQTQDTLEKKCVYRIQNYEQ